MAKATATYDHLSKRRFLLKFGGKDLAAQRISVRDGYFELLGDCDASDLAALQDLLGKEAAVHDLAAMIATLPLGTLTPIL